MHKGDISSEPITSMIHAEHCNSCGKCAKVCPCNAIKVDVKKEDLGRGEYGGMRHYYRC